MAWRTTRGDSFAFLKAPTTLPTPPFQITFHLASTQGPLQIEFISALKTLQIISKAIPELMTTIIKCSIDFEEVAWV